MKDKQFKVEGDEDNKYSLIGTAEYISPEMINEGKCGVGGDLWALGNKTFNSGCILYQFFHGYTPFFASTQHMIIQNIVNKNTIDIASVS
jgi:3-phosphoinositide dependent protein kinase-1